MYTHVCTCVNIKVRVCVQIIYYAHVVVIFVRHLLALAPTKLRNVCKYLQATLVNYCVCVVGGGG